MYINILRDKEKDINSMNKEFIDKVYKQLDIKVGNMIVFYDKTLEKELSYLVEDINDNILLLNYLIYDKENDLYVLSNLREEIKVGEQYPIFKYNLEQNSDRIYKVRKRGGK